MDELIEQLRHLGDATESSVASVSADQARTRSDTSPVTDIGSVPGADISSLRPAGVDSTLTGIGAARRSSRWPSSTKVVAAAAAVVVLLVGSIALIRRDASHQPVELAGAMQTDEPVAVPDDNGWAELRQCESTGDYTTDTGNTFYGAYQFTTPFWRDTALLLGLGDFVVTNPADAPPHIQDAIANTLYLEHGTDPWPICGRYIDGPMVTPVVPQWLGQQRSEEILTMVFNGPDVDDDQIAEINTAVEAIVSDGADTGLRQITFVDKEAAFAEFQAMFVHDEQIRESVQPASMPSSFRISATLSLSQITQLREIPGVFEVVQNLNLSQSAATAPMRISIAAIDLESPIYSVPSIDNLAKGATLIVNDPTSLVVGGHGAVDGSVFDRLDELRSGDIITITSLVADGSTPLELSRTFEVSAGIDAPSTEDLDDVPELWRDNDRQGLTLVADVADDPTQRLVIRAELIDPDPALYPTSDQ